MSSAPAYRMPRGFSPSSSATFDQCPSKWEAQYLLGIAGVPGIEAELGTLAHSVLEAVMCLPKERRTLAEAKATTLQVWLAFTKGPVFALFDTHGVDWTEFRRTLWAAVSRLWRLEDPAKVDVVSTEQRIQTVIDGVPFVGIIDRVDDDLGDLIVSDYKTGKIPSPQYSDEVKRQVRLYVAAVEADQGVRPKGGRVLYLKGRGKILDVPVAKDDVDDAVSWLVDTWNELERSVKAKSFEVRPGPLCGWCPRLPECDAGKADVRVRLSEGRNVGPGELVLAALDSEVAG